MIISIIIRTYMDIDQNSVKNIEIPFKTIKVDNIYDTDVNTSGNYAI